MLQKTDVKVLNKQEAGGIKSRCYELNKQGVIYFVGHVDKGTDYELNITKKLKTTYTYTILFSIYKFTYVV